MRMTVSSAGSGDGDWLRSPPVLLEGGAGREGSAPDGTSKFCDGGEGVRTATSTTGPILTTIVAPAIGASPGSDAAGAPGSVSRTRQRRTSEPSAIGIDGPGALNFRIGA